MRLPHEIQGDCRAFPVSLTVGQGRFSPPQSQIQWDNAQKQSKHAEKSITEQFYENLYKLMVRFVLKQVHAISLM